MKKVAIFGATGHTGLYITKKLMKEDDINLTLFVRNEGKLQGISTEKINIIKGDALNEDDVKKALDNIDILVCSLEGDVLTMAKNIVNNLSNTKIKQIIWITGMGIHHEIKGIRGKILNMYAKKRPEYIEAADLIASTNVNTTLLRCPGIVDGDNPKYFLTKEGVQPLKHDVEREGIAQCILDLINDERLGFNESLGITS